LAISTTRPSVSIEVLVIAKVRTGQLGRNVAQLSILPGTEAQEGERRALTAAELQALIDVSRDSRLVLIDLCGRNALRPAEPRGLRWLDLDLDSQELSVRGQQDRQNNRTEPKKAHNSARTIQLDKTTIDRLKAWREEQDDLRRRAGPAWQESGIVASTAFGTPVDRHSFARSMRLLCAKVGIDPPITPYELRHTAISMQADAGRSVWEIADWARTSEAMVSRIYRHRLRRVSTPATSARVAGVGSQFGSQGTSHGRFGGLSSLVEVSERLVGSPAFKGYTGRLSEATER